MKKQVKKAGKNWIFWTPRIIGLVYALFLMLFSLDVFGNGYEFWETVLGLLMHNLPAFALLGVLLLSWKYKLFELIAGIVFLIFGFLYILQMIINSIINSFEGYMLLWSIQIAGPAIFVGILFLINYKRKKVK